MTTPGFGSSAAIEFFRDEAERDQLEGEKWDRMEALHDDYERLREKARQKNVEFKDDSGTAAALRRIFGLDGSWDNCWWTTWRPF